MNVLLSIRPKFVEEIKNGNKQFEFRKNLFSKEKRHKIKKIYIYSSSPIKKVVAHFYVNEIIEDHPYNLWSKCKDLSGIKKEEFFAYFGQKKRGYAIAIKNLEVYDNPFDPRLFYPNFKPPQSFSYIEDFHKKNRDIKDFL